MIFSRPIFAICNEPENAAPPSTPVCTSRQMVYIDLLTDVDFTGEYTGALCIPEKKEYFSS
jgi:hypothetical protein